MTEYDNERKKELSEIIKNFSLMEINSSNLDVIIQLENEMTRNKEMIVHLNENGIIKNSEFQEKLFSCFNTFLKKISKNFGLDFCKYLYDYKPNEELTFLNALSGNKLVEEALLISSKSDEMLKLFYEMQELIDYKISDSFELGIDAISQHTSSFLELLNSEIEEISLIDSTIELQINSLDKISPFFTSEKIEDIIFNDYHGFASLAEKLEDVKIGLVSASSSIKKLACK